MATERTRHLLTPRAWWTVSVLSLGVAVTSLSGVLVSPTPAVVVLAHGPATVSAKSTSNPTSVARSIPRELSIPSQGIHVPVSKLGLQPNGQVQVPSAVSEVGWYEYGPTPGQRGSAVMLGHVDSYNQGAGTFYHLKDMKAGASINVTLADGTVAHFAVTKVVQYAKSAFPSRLVYGPSPTPTLQLVTCGGAFDYATGHYLANIVVFSHLVGVSTPTR